MREFATAEPSGLTDTDLVDAVTGFERMAAWAAARQYALLAEFHRPDLFGPPEPGISDDPPPF